MGIFDVLRYPISTPPTKEELEALPPDIFNRWLGMMGWSSDTDASDIELWYSCFPKTALRTGALDLLRRVIKEYNEPI